MSRIALAQITRSLDDPVPANRFLRNARDHGHRIERLIVAYSHGADEQAVRTLRRQTRLDLISARGDPGLSRRLSEAGLADDQVNALLDVPSWRAWNEIPYGAYRNAVLFTALLEGIDYLIFFDSDVQPRELVALEEEMPVWKEIDYVGEHLAALSLSGVMATSSEYSGYYIIPPMAFDGLDQFLTGLGKSSESYCLARMTDRGCLATSKPGEVKTEPTAKILGGNLGLSLGSPELLLPFYSSGYEFEGRYVMGRGEDTFLSHGLLDRGSEMIDIKLPVFHDTFVNFPTRPTIHTREVRDRFYNACLGWIGRNPLLAWHRAELGTLEISMEAEFERQRDGLQIGGEKAARYLSDHRFESLADALDSSVAALPQTIARYRSLMTGWNALQDTLTHRSYNLEDLGAEPA
jgi:hypothetical protein